MAGNLVLTRLLFPEAFGLMALMTILIQGMEMFSDIGITQNLIQSKHGESRAFRNTVWTMKIVRGAGIFAILSLLSYPISTFYDEPRLAAIIPVMALAPLIAGFGSTAPAIANRNLWLGRATVANLACQGLATICMIVWAWFSPTVWALVVGNLVQPFATAIVSHRIFPWWPNKIQWDSSAAREIVKFGKWMVLTSVLVFLAGQLDRLTLAKLVPLDLVGIYSIGFMWATLPLNLLQAWMGRVFFPLAADVFRQAGGDSGQLIAYRRRAMGLSLLGIGAFGGLIEPVYRLLYTTEYWPATEFLTIILFGVVVRIIDESYRAYNLALGQPKYSSFGAGASILIFAAVVYPLYGHFAAHGVAMAYSISQIGALVASVYGARKAGLADLKVDMIAVLLGLSVWAGLYFASRSLVQAPVFMGAFPTQ